MTQSVPIEGCASTLESRPAFPIVVAEFVRNPREVIRIAINFYKGKYFIDVRVWWHDADHTLRPGRSGITLAVRHLTSLAEALGDAQERAKELGLIQDDGDGG